MKKLLTIAVLATIPTFASADGIWGKHSDGYIKKKEGIEPYASHFSGAEIEQAVVAGLYAAHATGSTLTQSILLEELGATRPLSVVMREKIQQLRQWAAERTVKAN